MMANRLLTLKWGATAALETDFPKIPHPKSDPMHQFLTQRQGVWAKIRHLGSTLGQNLSDSAPTWDLPKLGPIGSGEILGVIGNSLIWQCLALAIYI